MSVSCVGTCSHCGDERFWLSDTLSLQMDDGRLVCLPHPAESGSCERHGLTLSQASKRGRLFRETFYVCRNCGRDGETIEHVERRDDWQPSVGGTMKWCWGLAAVVVPVCIWLQWHRAAFVIGISLLVMPLVVWREGKKRAKDLAARGLPGANAPGAMQIPEPTAGLSADSVVGRALSNDLRNLRATGPCCEKPDWVEAFSVTDEYRVPCWRCGKGLMTVSDHSIH